MMSSRHVTYKILALAIVACLAAAICALPGPWGGARRAQAVPSDAPNFDNWVTDGPVCSIASDGDTTYLGGFFNYVGPNTGYGVPFDTTSGSPAGNYPRIENSVQTVVPDGSGGWYIGGYFTSIDGMAIERLAHILDDGTLDTSFHPDVDGTVYTIVLSGSILYAGGTFTSIQGSSGGPYARSNLAAIDTATGNPTGFNPGPTGVVRALALSSDGLTLYTGGGFGGIQGSSGGPYARSYIAAIDTATGNPTSWNPTANNIVVALAVSGSNVYAGGNFTSILGSSGGPYLRSYIAAIDTVTANCTAWNPGADSTLVTLAVSGSTVYAGGNFAHLQGNSGGPYARGCVAAIDADPVSPGYGNPTAWNPSANSVVNALAVSGSAVYIGGGFTSVQGASGGPYTRNCFAAIDAATGNPTGMVANANSFVLGLAVDGSDLYVGGGFFSIGGQRRLGLAALDAATGDLTGWNPGAASVRSIVLSDDGSTLYAGGQFTSVQGTSGGPYTRNRIAAIDTATGNPTAFNPGASDEVFALALDGSTLYAGGSFMSVQGATGGPYARSFIAAIDIPSSNPTTWRPNTDGPVVALALSETDPTLYIGGNFLNMQGVSGGPYARNRIAAIDTVTGNPTSWNPDADGMVRTLLLSGSTLYAGGYFAQIQGASGGPYTRNRIAAIDTATGNPTAFNPGLSDYVQALALDGSTLYAGGAFTSVQGSSGGPYARDRIAAIDTATGNPTAWDPGADSVVMALEFSGSTLYAGGAFQAIGGRQCANFAGFDGQPSVDSITPSNGENDGTVSVTDLAGADFRAGASVLLRKTGETDIAADNVTVVSASQITCDFDLTGAAAGDWDVVVVNPDTQEGTLAGGFTVIESPPVPWYLAEGCTEGGMETWVLVQNPGAAAVNVDLILQTSSGEQRPAGLQDQSIPAGSRRSFNLGAYWADWNISTKVEADSGVICERAMYGGERTWAHDSIGVTAPAATWFLAEGCTGPGFETWVLVQNPNASAVNVDFTLMTSSGAMDGPQNYPIAANSRQSFRLNDYVTDWNVSTKVDSWGGGVICERAMYGNGRTWAHDCVGVTQPAADWFLAEGCTGPGFETWVLVQNPYPTQVAVDLTFMTSAGPVAGPQGFAIPANSRHSFRVNDYVTDYDVSTTVSSTSTEIICERAVYGNGRVWAHDSIGATGAQPVWYLAEGCTEGGMETWVLVQNPGGAAVTVDLVLQTSTGEQRPAGLQDQVIPAGSRRSFNLGEYWADWNVSTKVEADGGVICERAMYGGERTWAHDSVGFAP